MAHGGLDEEVDPTPVRQNGSDYLSFRSLSQLRCPQRRAGEEFDELKILWQPQVQVEIAPAINHRLVSARADHLQCSTRWQPVRDLPDQLLLPHHVPIVPAPAVVEIAYLNAMNCDLLDPPPCCTESKPRAAWMTARHWTARGESQSPHHPAGRRISHGGTWAGWLAKTVRLPERQIAATIASTLNSSRPMGSVGS